MLQDCSYSVVSSPYRKQTNPRVSRICQAHWLGLGAWRSKVPCRCTQKALSRTLLWLCFPLEKLQLSTRKAALLQACFPGKHLPLAVGGRLRTQITLRSSPHMPTWAWAAINVFPVGLLSPLVPLLLCGRASWLWGAPWWSGSAHRGWGTLLPTKGPPGTLHTTQSPGRPAGHRQLCGQVGTCPQDATTVGGHHLTPLGLTALLGQEGRSGAGSLGLEIQLSPSTSLPCRSGEGTSSCYGPGLLGSLINRNW